MEKGNRPIPNTLRLHRKALGYSQKHAASLLGLESVRPLKSWEKGTTLPSTVYLFKLCILLGKTPRELYTVLTYSLREEMLTKEFE